MIPKPYDSVMLFMGILSTRGFPESVKDRLESMFGPVCLISPSMPFTFTDYYDPEMGSGIERFFIAFERLVQPDSLAEAKTLTDSLEMEMAIDGRRCMNLDPGLISEGSVVLATTKNRAHRIAIGSSLYAEVTLIYHSHGFESFPWTYADYRSLEVQETLLAFRRKYLELRKADR